MHPSVSEYVDKCIESLEEIVENDGKIITSFAIVIASDKACEKIAIETELSKHLIIEDDNYELVLNEVFRGVVQRLEPTMNKIKHRNNPTEWWIEIKTANSKLPLRLSNEGEWIKQRKRDNKFNKGCANELILPILASKDPFSINVYIQAKGLKKQKVKYADQEESE